MVQRPCRRTRVVTPANVENKAAIWFEDSLNFGREGEKPLDISRLVNVSVFLFKMKRVRRRCDYRLYRLRRKASHDAEGIRNICCAERGSVKRRGFRAQSYWMRVL
jgi:hypothetical protein